MKIDNDTYSVPVPASFDEVVAHCTQLVSGKQHVPATSAALNQFGCFIFWNTACGLTEGCNDATLHSHNISMEQYLGRTCPEVAGEQLLDVEVYKKFENDNRVACRERRVLFHIRDKPLMLPSGFFVPLSFRAPIIDKVTGQTTHTCGMTINIAFEVMNFHRVVSDDAWQMLQIAEHCHQQLGELDKLAENAAKANADWRFEREYQYASIATMRTRFQRMLHQIVHERQRREFTPLELFADVQASMTEESASGIQLDYDMADPFHRQRIQGHYGILRQLLWQLLENGIKHASATKITCRFAPTKLALVSMPDVSCNVLTVTDNGQGLSTALQAYVMDPDCTQPHPTGRNGLSLLKHTVYRVLGGALFCECTPDGHVALHAVLPSVSEYNKTSKRAHS